MITIDQQIAEVRRELGMRRYKYPQWVAGGSLTQTQADDRLARMDAVLATLERLREAEPKAAAPQGGLF